MRELIAGVVSPVERSAAPPVALIAPHAGYVYSGPVAASAYGTLGGHRGRIERVVVLGPAHRRPVRGLALPAATAMATPLGEMPVDRARVEELAALPQVVVDDAPHALEHSVEVQLPFLQVVLGEVPTVPIVVGDSSDERVAEVIELARAGARTLIVVSTDLSHYHDYDTARRLDRATCASIERLDPAALAIGSACGRVPLGGLLRVAGRHGWRVELLDACSSGDTAGDRVRVVGYAAFALRGDRESC